MSRAEEYKNMTKPRFADRVVFVTGAGGGIGTAIAARFSSEGAKVVVADLQAEQVASIADQLVRDGGEALPVTLDVGNKESVAAACGAIVERWGRLDIMVCNAGVRPVGSVLEQSTTEFELALRVNVTGVFLCGQAAARQMVKQRSGAIINIASVNGFRAVTGMAAYNASKAAVVSLTHTMASELAPHGIRVNAIAPAQIETPMIAEQVGDERKRREERIPMGRYGKPSEIADAIAYLASDDASFVNGHVLAVDGGYLGFGFRPSI
jgi:3-oxoacyl-[acyl-carrier protein] reductase